MKIQTLKCPNCGGTLDIEDGIDTFFCKYCGSKLFLEEMSDASIQARVQIKNMEHQERMLDKKHEQERYRFDKKEQIKKSTANRKIVVATIIALACILFFVWFFGSFSSMEKKSIQEEAQLQALVEEIMVDIENGDFDEAYVKANSLHYTSGWSSEIEDKWDDTRNALLKEIKRAEKESARSENDGFFDWFN